MNRDVERNRMSVGIEALLIWAYRDQLVHQAQREPVELTHSKAGPLAAYSSLWNEAAPIEASRRLGFEAADDAWQVHRLVTGLGKYGVDCGAHLRASRYHRLGQYRGAEPPVERRSVDHTARPWPTDGRLEVDLRGHVIFHATRASRPTLPGREPISFKPAERVWHPNRRGGVYGKGWYSHVTAQGDLPGDRLRDWEVYMAWRGCLVRLQRALQATRLVMFTVTDALPLALEKPRGPLD